MDISNVSYTTYIGRWVSWYAYSLLNKVSYIFYNKPVDSSIYMDHGAKVCENVFIGSLSTATDATWLRVNKVSAIINLSGVIYKSHVPVMNIIMDDSTVDMKNIDDYIKKFSTGASKIKNLVDEDKTVLVHCAAGINRSAATICYYLINAGNDYNDAINAITLANNKRGVPTLTNESFRYLLRLYSASKVPA